MKALKKILAMILIINIVISLPIFMPIIDSQAAETVTLSLIPQPYIDVVLSKSRTSTELTNFKQNLLDALKSRAVDTTKVNVSDIESFQIAVTDSFNWTRYTHRGQDGSNGPFHGITGDHITVYSNNSILFQGYEVSGYKDFLLYPDTTSKTKTIEFTVNTSTAYWHTLDAAGFLVNSEIKNGNLAGYAVMIRNGYVSVYKFNDGLSASSFSNSSGGSMSSYAQSLRDYTISDGLGTHRFVLTVESDAIIIEDNGREIINMSIPPVSQTAHGFGPISSYNSHNCDELSQITFTNVHMEVENIKSLNEVLREPEWREDAIKVLVNVEDIINEELNKPTSLGEILTRMINEEIHYVEWGKTANETQADNFITANNNNGTYINNRDYQDSINKTADYIKSLIEEKQSSNYVLLNENTIATTEDENIMKNTQSDEFPYGKWKIIHDCEYFENNIGQFADTGNYIPDMITSFNKTGKYEILYEDRNIQPTYIYVHRKPVAEIGVKREGNILTLTNLGYDLDHYSENNGVADFKWEYRTVGENIWHDGMLTDLSSLSATDFLVQLTVKDQEGVWSAPSNKYITMNQNVLPIASFKIKNRTSSIYEDIDIVDGSYDPYGGEIVSRTWKVYDESGSEIYSGPTPLLNYMDRGTGNYTIGLIVKNDREQTSEEFKRMLTIIPDDEAPEFVAIPTSSDWIRSVNVELTFKDRLGSGFASYKYVITESQSAPTEEEYSEEITRQNDTITIDEDGIKYLHIVTKDNAGNISKDRVVGPYKIDRTPPEGTIDYDRESWSIDTMTLHWHFTDAGSGYNRTTLPNESDTSNIGGYYDVHENGTYNFTTYDNLGNKRTVTETVTNIDKNAPHIILSLQKEELTGEPTYITWNVVDFESGFDRIVMPDNTVSYEETGQYKIQELGEYSFIAYDKVGNDRSITINVTNVDLKNPKLQITQDYNEWTNDDIVLHWKAEDGETGIREVVLPNAETSKELEGDHVVTKNGTYAFIAYDNVGNGIIVRHEVNNIDKEAPILELSMSEDGNKIIWRMQDDQSGIKNIILPTGESIEQETGEFEITKRQSVYTFIAYDSVGNYTIQEIRV